MAEACAPTLAVAAPALFPPVAERCDSFSRWWSRATRGLQAATDLLAVNEVPSC
jgi:deoxyribodipyrimidine photo-lyase